MQLHLTDNNNRMWLLEDDVPEPRASLLLERAKVLNAAVCEIAARVEVGDEQAKAYWHSGLSFAKIARQLGLPAEPHCAEVTQLTAK